MKIKLSHSFNDIVSTENLLLAWGEFIKGKRQKLDVQEFSLHLMDNIFALHYDLVNLTYKHSQYQEFSINDPKPRIIHKAQVRDRLLHHAIHRLLYPFFDKTFIANSYACRKNKGTHKALNRFRKLGYKVSKNSTKTCWVLKGDIKKFFANVNHNILIEILQSYILDKNTMWLLKQVISSFNPNKQGIGLPLGNLTSQLFANVYLNKLDQFVKHKLKVKYYIRYADDFVVLSESRGYLEKQIKPITNFLQNHLQLTLHPKKVFIKTLASGVDFLGWTHFQNHRVLRTKTKQRMLKRIKASPTKATLISYWGLLKWGNACKIKQMVYETTYKKRSTKQNN